MILTCPHCRQATIPNASELCSWCDTDLSPALEHHHAGAYSAHMAAAATLMQNHDGKGVEP